jgi:hypothetical protein
MNCANSLKAGRDKTVDIPLLLVAALAVCLVVARACLQSATIDEADSYLGFSTLPWPSHWYPTSGNHVLNSMIVRLLTKVFGLSHLTFRSGAIIGAVIFIASTYCISVRFIDTAVLRWVLFVSSVFNPFILDYLVASRGYGLALGFLMAAVLMLTSSLVAADTESSTNLYRRCSLASVFVALSFSANFAFAFVDGVVMLVFLMWTWPRRRDRWFAIAAATSLPGLFAITLIAGSTLLHWPKGQLHYGAISLQEMWSSLVSSTLYELNPQVANPLILPLLEALGRVLPDLFYAGLVVLLANVVVSRLSIRGSDPGRLSEVAGYLACVLVISVAAYWLAHRAVGILLPKERTASFFVPISTVLFGVCTGFRGKSRFGSAPHVVGVVILTAAWVYFVGCLRLFYFKEWKFDAETNQAFCALTDATRARGIREVNAVWQYNSTMEFYDLYYNRRPTFHFLVTDVRPPRTDEEAYVLDDENDREFIKQQNLRVVYHGEFSPIVVAIRPLYGPWANADVHQDSLREASQHGR